MHIQAKEPEESSSKPAAAWSSQGDWLAVSGNMTAIRVKTKAIAGKTAGTASWNGLIVNGEGLGMGIPQTVVKTC
jgi:hypothetical protein